MSSIFKGHGRLPCPACYTNRSSQHWSPIGSVCLVCHWSDPLQFLCFESSWSCTSLPYLVQVRYNFLIELCIFVHFIDKLRLLDLLLFFVIIDTHFSSFFIQLVSQESCCASFRHISMPLTQACGPMLFQMPWISPLTMDISWLVVCWHTFQVSTKLERKFPLYSSSNELTA